MALLAARRSIRRTISATHRCSSATVMLAGIETRSTPPTSRACTVLRRRALRTTSTFTVRTVSRRRDLLDCGCDGPLAGVIDHFVGQQVHALGGEKTSLRVRSPVAGQGPDAVLG